MIVMSASVLCLYNNIYVEITVFSITPIIKH